MENYNNFVKIIEDYGLTGEDVLNLLTNWHGTDIVSDEFLDNLESCEGFEML